MKKGLTLIEVLLAIVILSVGLTVLLTGASRCLAVMKAAKNYQTAQWTMGMGEADFPLVETNDIKALAVQDFVYPNGFVYSREIDEDEDEDGLYVMHTRVVWSDKGRETREEVVRYVFRPDDKKP